MERFLQIALCVAPGAAVYFWLSRTRRSGPRGASDREASETEASLEPLDFKALERTPRGRPRVRPAHAAWELKGRVHVIDGDTIVMGRKKIRLAGIDAPELDQPYGKKAKWTMVEICRNEVVTARPTGDMSHDRIVATCYLSDGTDIGAELIRRGLALDWPRFSGGRYKRLECPVARRKILNGRRWHKSRNPTASHREGQP